MDVLFFIPSESSVQLLFKDHLGSIHTIMDGNAMTLLQRQSFDPFGQRRNATNWQDLLDSQLSSFNTSYTTRGFTGHEQLDEVGLIHMNGRVYDPKLGRFLQADPFIQAAGNTQSFNRYSYVLNNPLNAVDPSGYFFKWVKKKIKKITRSVIKGLSKVFGPELVNIVGSFVAGYYGGAAGVAAWNYEFARAMGASSGDALKSGAIAGASAFAFNAIGAKFNGAEGTWNAAGGAAHIAAHAITGGVISELQGGKFGHGFISAGFTKFATSNMNVIQGKSAAAVAGRTTVAALIGGTASKLTGGKFANGAQTAAMAHLFNAEGKVIAKIGKDVFTFSGNTEDYYCGSTGNTECKANLAGGTMLKRFGNLYVSEDSQGYKAYSDAVKVNLASHVSDGMTLITVVFPASAPVAGGVALFADGVKIIYSDNPAETAAQIAIGKIGGGLSGKAAMMRNPSISGHNVQRIEAIGGKVSEESLKW
ncbi:RHS repeat domain-containing protein [Endozoicomonas sp. ALC020]|uniref:RHS repeat domain-containing protein n=1 Tax=unclassified Endozoicomonas TaxID=2644528 RepID=UPI003BAF1052